LKRRDAILIIVKAELTNLAREKREELLLEWWNIDEEDLFFLRMPKLLQLEILNSDEPINDIMGSNYDILLIEALKYEYIGVINEYLSKIVSNLLNDYTEVEGAVENLLPCVCCGYKTLKEQGQYEVCPICYWEDDGNYDLLAYSSPNHMTLQEYKRKKDFRNKDKEKYAI